MDESTKKAIYALHEENMMLLRTMYQHGRISKQEADSVIMELDEIMMGALEDEELSGKK